MEWVNLDDKFGNQFVAKFSEVFLYGYTGNHLMALLHSAMQRCIDFVDNEGFADNRLKYVVCSPRVELTNMDVILVHECRKVIEDTILEFIGNSRGLKGQICSLILVVPLVTLGSG